MAYGVFKLYVAGVCPATPARYSWEEEDSFKGYEAHY
jgi:hypothetical protein